MELNSGVDINRPNLDGSKNSQAFALWYGLCSFYALRNILLGLLPLVAGTVIFCFSWPCPEWGKAFLVSMVGRLRPLIFGRFTLTGGGPLVRWPFSLESEICVR